MVLWERALEGRANLGSSEYGPGLGDPRLERLVDLIRVCFLSVSHLLVYDTPRHPATHTSSAREAHISDLVAAHIWPNCWRSSSVLSFVVGQLGCMVSVGIEHDNDHLNYVHCMITGLFSV